MMRFATGLFVCLLGSTLLAADDAFSRQSIPQKWLNRILPEDLPPLEYPSYANDLDKARMQVHSGRYKQSLLTLLSVTDAPPIETAMIRATALAALGRRDRAIEVLSDPAVVDHPRAQVKRATILAEMGKTEESLNLLKQHIDKNPNSIAGRYWLGAIQEQVGDQNAARATYEWFMVDPQNFLQKWQQERERALQNAEELTYIGRAMDRWATLTGSYKDLPQLHNALLNIFVRTYDVIDRSYWPAHLAAAEFFIVHDNTPRAIQELQAAAKTNPNDPLLNEIIGKVVIDQWNFDAADSAIETLRDVDPDSIAADLLETRNLLQQRRPADAALPVERVLVKQPNNIEALGLFAATYALRLQDDKTEETLKRVEKLDPDNATAYLEVAEQLGALRQYPRAIEKYKVAIERAPWWTAARNGLGLLYTQSGDEDDAKATLDAARILDPFNLRTTNYLRLLDDLQKFARKETEHFVLMYDEKLDPMIPEYFTEYLESIHAEVCKNYAKEPPVKTYIEVFPTHDAFSVRTTGSPWIGTVGASTGRVIAMVAPRKGEVTMGAFNWAQVLRHEYTHTVTLAATDNRIPHWMTEGLAVLEEQSPIKWEWVPMLYHAVTTNGLFTMDTLTWGFVRPRKPSDRSLAYAQSHWICKYIQQTYGHDAILKMLAEFRNGQSEKDTFQKILGKSLDQFQTEFFSWAAQQVASWGYDEATQKKYDELREKAEATIKSGNYTEAVKAWEEIIKIRPVDQLPHMRLAGLYLNARVNNPAKAIEHLKVLHAVELKDNAFAKRIAGLYRDTNNLPEAMAYATQAVYIDPYDPSAHRMLLDIAKRSNDTKTVERETRVIPVLEKWIEANRPKPLPG